MATPTSAPAGMAAVRALLSALREKPEEKFAPAFGGDTKALGLAAQVQRDGQPDSRLAGASKEELAQLDRFAQFEGTGEEVGLIGLPSAALMAGGYEAFGKSPAVGNLLSKITGDQQYQVDETTSKPSMGNFRAAVRGFLSGARKRK